MHDIDPVDGSDGFDLRNGSGSLDLAYDEGVVLAAGEVGVVEAIAGGTDERVGRSADSAGREATVGDGCCRGSGGLDVREHDSGRAEVEGLAGPNRASRRDADDGRGAGGVQGPEARESLLDTALAVLHVHEDVVKASERSYLG